MKLRPFELVLVVLFGALLFGALILLRTYKPAVEENVTKVGTVSIWGVLPQGVFDSMLREVSTADAGFNTVYYRYIPPEDFDSVFVNALADQKAPDLLLLPHDKLIEHRSRLQPISYESYPLRTFRSTYIDGAEIFAMSDGLYGLPVAVDPLLMYWNRDIFATNGLITAPLTWEAVVADIVPTLTVRDYNRNIKLASIAMGEYGNIKNAFPILSMLLLQGGSVLVTESKKQYQVRLDEIAGQNSSARPFANAAAFYTNFSNTNNTLYSWNRSLRLDKEMFLSEDLALYFGYASEGIDIATKNPNLNFDVAEVPQGAAATVKRTYGQFYAFVIPSAAPNKAGAQAAMQKLASSENTKKLVDGYNLAPVYRTLVAEGSADVYGRIAYQSAIYTQGWLNPDTEKVDEVWGKMLDDINANRSDINAAASDAVNRLRQIY